MSTGEAVQRRKKEMSSAKAWYTRLSYILQRSEYEYNSEQLKKLCVSTQNDCTLERYNRFDCPKDNNSPNGGILDKFFYCRGCVIFIPSWTRIDITPRIRYLTKRDHITDKKKCVNHYRISFLSHIIRFLTEIFSMNLDTLSITCSNHTYSCISIRHLSSSLAPQFPGAFTNSPCSSFLNVLQLSHSLLFPDSISPALTRHSRSWRPPKGTYRLYMHYCSI